MESTGSTISKSDRNELPKEHWRFIPSIGEQHLGDNSKRKKLQILFDRYLKPQQSESKAQDVQKEWGKQFKESINCIKKVDVADETNFIMDIIIYYLYYEIVNDRAKYPKTVPFVDLPQEMIEFLVKKAQNIFSEEKALIAFEAPVKILGDIHGQYTDLLHMFKEMSEKNKYA